MYRIRGAILIGIFLTAIVSWPRPTAVTYFPHTAAGDQMFDFFKQVVAFRKLEKIGNAIDVRPFLSIFVILSRLTFNCQYNYGWVPPCMENCMWWNMHDV